MDAGKAIRNERIRQGMSQKELGIRLNVNNTYVCDLEKNRKYPSRKMAEKLAMALSTPYPVILMRSIELSDIPFQKRDTYKASLPAINALLASL